MCVSKTLTEVPKRVWLEVIGLWGVVIGFIFVFKLLEFIPLVRENLWGIAGILFLFVPIEYLYRRGCHPSVYGISAKKLGSGALWASILAVAAFPLYLPAFGWWFERSAFQLDLPPDFFKIVVGNLFLVALPEEAFYRGYMQGRLDGVFRGRMKVLGAEVGWSVVVASVFFAVGHLVEFRPDKLGTFFPGLLFGWLRARTGTIAGAVIFHAMCNIWAQILGASFGMSH